MSRLIIIVLDSTKQFFKLRQYWQRGVRIHCFWTFGNLELTVEPCRCSVAIHSCFARTWESFVARKVQTETCYLERNNNRSHNKESQYFGCCANFLPPSHFTSSSAGGPTAPSTSHLLVRKLLFLSVQWDRRHVSKFYTNGSCNL